jgi:Skp family chaperone for outer membrane proteins
LSKGGNAMAQAAKDELARNIDAKTKSFNRDMEDAQAEAQTEQTKMLEELSGKMQVVIDKFALANGYTALLDVSNQNTNVIWINPAIDVTKEIIDLYDKMNPGGPATKPTSMPTTKPAAPAAPPTAPAPVKKQP